ncbi:hypothetical protein Tsubulata_038673 [Turnera subulata]|uniref:Scarecrow-like protein 14 n=1 Tax=Turnera subulata TaxID=218843 RepID=A0A9Q0FIM1_9ROSI|nr:hypothetical protein Tsubulata_038673 [Turnera subulata]
MGSFSGFNGFSGSTNGFKFAAEGALPNPTQNSNFGDGFTLDDPSLGLDFSFLDSSAALPERDGGQAAQPSAPVMYGSPSSDGDASDPIFNYINQILMEEDLEKKPCMFHDPLALQATEKSLYDVISVPHPPTVPQQSPFYGDQFLVDSPDDGLSSSTSEYSSNSSFSPNTGTATVTSVEPQSRGDVAESKPSFMQMPVPSNFVFQSTAKPKSKSSLLNGLASNANRALRSKILVPTLFNDRDLALQFKKGAEEANKFLPKGNQLVVDLESSVPTPPQLKEKDPNLVARAEQEYSPASFWGKKNREREVCDIGEERSNKQSAVFGDEVELSELFDSMFICDKERWPPSCIHDHDHHGESGKAAQHDGHTNRSSGGNNRVNRLRNKKEVVDLDTLLILCAQAVSTDDFRTANELLKQIRRHSSPLGDASQRLAHYFANGLEARVAGSGTHVYSSLSTDKTTAADTLEAYQAYISACPFMKMAIIFANHNILRLAENAATLHIIDFGILYGFQWPTLIYHLSKRPGGSPKLRITGIELPQSGFRPAERVQETGRRLAKYCKRHNVPFEFNAVAQKWDNIKIDDLKINSGEVVAVNCLYRFKNLLDETVLVESPRDIVLDLVTKIKPDIFTHGVVNGSYNAPFFVARFREAMFHFTTLFDMCDAIMPREDQMRLKFEKEFYGREIMNIIACEGSERVERPEPYKQWHFRNTRAGLKQLPLNPAVLKDLKRKVRAGYHDDFVVDEDGHWMLQGWKGRIVFASSVWVPANDNDKTW